MSRAPWWSALLALTLLLAGCAAEEEPLPTEKGLRIEVGAGRTFTPLRDGDVVEMVRGSQGGYHIFVSLRAWELSSPRAEVELTLTRVEDGREMAFPYKLQRPFEPGPDARSPATVESVLLMLTDPPQADGRQMRLTASVLSEFGERATDARTITLQRCTTSCP
jgi:hypothetical protein